MPNPPINQVKIKIGDNHHHVLGRFFIDYDKPINQQTGYPSAETELTQCVVNFALPVNVSIQEILQWQYQQNLHKEVHIEFYSNRDKQFSYTLGETYLRSLEKSIQKADNGWMQYITLHLSPLSVEMDKELYEQSEEDS